MTTEKFNYNLYIKKKLIEWREAFEKSVGSTLNYSAIAKKMEDDFGIITSTQKISAMFDEQSNREVKLQELVALTTIFHIPLQDICEYPNAPSSNFDTFSLIKKSKFSSSAITQVNNRFYHGDYYCYYFKPKHYQDQLKPISTNLIEEAIINISIENGHSTITLKEMQAGTTFYGDPLPSFTLTGNLYHYKNTDMAYSFISDISGQRVMAIMFTYLNLSSDIRYYITAGMMTFSLNQIHTPLFQKMAIFRVRQNLKDEKQTEILRGILSLNTTPLVFDMETLEQLRQEDSVFKQMLTPEKAIKQCYAFSETALRSDLFSISNENVKMQKMLKLRKNSMLPAHEIINEPDYFADFIKHYQQDQLKN